MARLGIDKDSIKRFFSLHVEKIVLGVVVLLLVLFVYRGYSLEGLASDKRPDVLKTKAVAVKDFLSDSKVEKIIVEENRQETGFVQRTKAGQAPINSTVYPSDMVLSPGKPSGRLRTDPEIFAPVEIEAVAMSAAMPYVPARGETDPFKDDENMAPKKVEETKPKRSKRGRNDRKKDAYPGAEDMPAPDGGFAGLSDIPGMSEGAPGMPGGPGFGELGVGEVIMANLADVEGFRPPVGAIVITKHIVGVTALVPYRKQWDEFDAKFSSAMGNIKSRDVPTYLGFYAERTEVTDEDDTDFKWTAISNSDFVVKQMMQGRRPYGGWAGYPQEIADPRYVAPNILTMPIPPVVLKSVDEIVLHSKVPKYQVGLDIPGTTEEEDASVDDPGGVDAIGSAPSLGRSGSGAGFGSEGAPGMEGIGGYGTGAPGMQDTSGTGVPGMNPPGMGAPVMMEGEGTSGYGSGGYGAEDTLLTSGPTVDYLMVRFFDLSIRDPAKKYRYRIQLWVEDPNHPKNPLADPNVRALAPEVRARITDIKAKEEAAKRRLSYFRTTEFSEPSAMVSFDDGSQTLGGEIAMVGDKVIADSIGNRFKLWNAERSAKVMSVVWDTKRAIEVPGVVNAHRGTFLNFVLDADVVHPVSLQYKTIKDYSFRTNRMVLDFRGGEPLPVPKEEQEDKPLYAPAEFLFLNEKGELFVKNELDDWDGFKKRLPPVPLAVDPIFLDPEGAGQDMLPGGEDAIDIDAGRGRSRSGRGSGGT